MLRLLAHVSAGVRSGAVYPRTGERLAMRAAGLVRWLGARPFPVVPHWETPGHGS